MQNFQVRKWLRRIGLAIVAVALIATSASSDSLTALAQATSKQLSTNFTLIGFSGFPITFTVEFIKDDGSQWRPDEEGTLTAENPQAIFAQYFDNQLTGGRGSVRVNSSSEVGAVVQIQARPPQVASHGAYNGASSGADQVAIPLVCRRSPSASGTTNSTITVQNTGAGTANVEIDFYKYSDGSKLPYVKTGISLVSGQSLEYDLDTDNNIAAPDCYSAIVRVVGEGQITAVSNNFVGPDALLTTEGFLAPTTGVSASALTVGAQEWVVPLFLSRLPKGAVSSPVTVQNVSGGTIPAGQVVMSCTPTVLGDDQPFQKTNPNPIVDRGSYAFNPVTDQTIPTDWVGACIITTGGADVVAFVQQRFVSETRAAAYPAIPVDESNTTKVSIPLYTRLGNNNFVTALTIVNMDQDNTNRIRMTYTAKTGSPAGCSAVREATMPAGGNQIENHRVGDATPNSVPDIDPGCAGSILVESLDNRPIAAFIQLDILGAAGDPFMAHTGFAVQ